MRGLLERAIAALPDLYKNVLLLRDMEELSVKETGGDSRSLRRCRENPASPRTPSRSQADQTNIFDGTKGAPRGTSSIVRKYLRGCRNTSMANCRRIWKRGLARHIDDCAPCVEFVESLRKAKLLCASFRARCSPHA